MTKVDDTVLTNILGIIQLYCSVTCIGIYIIYVDVSKDLKKAMGLLDKLTDWESLGLELGLHFSTLDAIKIEERGRVRKCMMRMLVAWLKKSDNVSSCHGPSWKQLIESLRAIEENSLADDIERRLLNKRSCDQSSSTPPSSKRSTNRDEVNDESSSRESSISSQRQERRQHKRQRTDEEDNSDYDDNTPTSITKQQPPRSHDIELESHHQSTSLHGKEPAGGRCYKRKRRPDSDSDSHDQLTRCGIGGLRPDSDIHCSIKKRQRTDEEDNSDSNDNITASSINKRQPPRSHDKQHSSRSHNVQQPPRSHDKFTRHDDNLQRPTKFTVSISYLQYVYYISMILLIL